MIMLKRERTNDRTGRHTSQKILALMLTAVFAGQLAKAQTRYTITDLDVLPGGNYSEAFGINNRGQVTGSSDLAPGQNRASFIGMAVCKVLVHWAATSLTGLGSTNTANWW